MEEWRSIPGYEGLYEVSSYGRVKSLDRYVKYLNGMIHLHKGKVLSPGIRSDGHLQVSLCCNGKYKTISVHRLVAQAFIHNPDNLPMINHKDENPGNNNVDNLEWCDAKYNNNYGTLQQRRIQTNINNGKYTGYSKTKEYRKEYSKKYNKEHREHLREYLREYRKRKRGQ